MSTIFSHLFLKFYEDEGQVINLICDKVIVRFVLLRIGYNRAIIDNGTNFLDMVKVDSLRDNVLLASKIIKTELIIFIREL